MGRRYRVCQYVEDQEIRLALCEVMTEEDGTTTCLRVASTQVFATIEDLKRGLEQMRSGCELPVLTVTQLSDDIDGVGGGHRSTLSGSGTGIRTPVPWLRTTCPDP